MYGPWRRRWPRRYWRRRRGCGCCPIVLLGLALGAVGMVMLVVNLAAPALLH